ncbi:hypothetical protein [Shewanella psychrotolerans]|uniref:hypothetical protein n=1 Tax=Shewanella psychrotolerans TaxID=2864206 RepID=UPI001C65A76F|nr:hypothetical protein [Shewanella psychrotolerans]QYK02506.1 hypothetical protein K0I62_06040 [Shewanella psychrotolerans]
MTPIEQVLAAAKAIATSGKSPSLALIKSKVGNSIPMPLLVQGLQRFKALSKAEIELLTFENQQPNSEKIAEKQGVSLENLQQQVHTLQQQQQILVARIDALEASLKNRDRP